MWLVLSSVLGSISWAAPPSCPPESELQERLKHVKTAVSAVVKELPDAQGFELEVRIADQPRTLRTPTCIEAADTTVFLAELVEGAPVTRKPMEVQVTTEQRTAALVKPEPLRRHLSALAGAEWILLPNPVPRFGLAFQYDVPFIRIGAEVRIAPPLRFISLAGGGVVLAPLLDLQVNACHLFEFGRFGFGPCVQGGFGLVSAEALGFDNAIVRVIPVWTVGPAGRFAVEITPGFELQFFVATRFGPQPIYTYDDSRVLLRTNLMGLDTGLGLGARW
ncbi:MAG: hypothetical protein JNM17_36945 [Archangium sp.]|nr:hypothetical protein [Archangium sp.]